MELNKEKEIVELAKKDRAQFGVLFDHFYPMIFKYVLKRSGDAVASQDIAAETFFKAMTNLHKFKWQGVSISNWLYKIATNELNIYFRKHKYKPASLEVLFEQDGFEPMSDYNLAEETIEIQTQLERHQDYVQAMTALMRLPLKYQEVIVLRFTEKKKLSEIVLILGKKEGTIKSLLSRGLARLRQELERAKMQPIEEPSIVVAEGQVLTIPGQPYEE